MSFEEIKARVGKLAPWLAEFGDLEYETYKRKGHSHYFAGDSLVAVFTDCTERSPTFNLDPIDTVEEKVRKSWLCVWTDADNTKGSWEKLLNRDYEGLTHPNYKENFDKVEDPFLREKALRSLNRAGPDQSLLYDFSFTEPNITRLLTDNTDFSVLCLLTSEIESFLKDGAK